MRTFDSLEEAISEIYRDLSRSPRVQTGRVQQFKIQGEVHEAMNYGYSIKHEGFPADTEKLVELGAKTFPYWAANADRLLEWLKREEATRCQDRVEFYADEAELPESLHPALAELREGETYAYTYQERLAGAREALTAALRSDPYTRRAYFPIFHREDAIRACRMTRIPCSLGYSVVIRPVPERGEYLCLTYLQRSCDFDRFWLSDLWLAHRWKVWLLESLRERIPGMELQPGEVSHFILSLHSFISGEVY